jgi:YidC/Oxa1 family membrane protein insertase
MDKRAIIGIALSILVLVIYQEWVSRYYGPMIPGSAPVEEDAAKQVAPPAAVPGTVPPAPPPALPSAQFARDVRVETDNYVAILTSRGARLKSFKFKHYRTSVSLESPPYEMVQAAPGIPLPLGVRWQTPAPFDDSALVYTVQGRDVVLRGDAKATLVFQGTAPDGAVITKTFSFSGSAYPIQLEVQVTAAEGTAPIPEVMLTEKSDHTTINYAAPFEGFLALVNSKITRESASEAAKGLDVNGEVSWAGFGHTYFYFGLLPENGAQRKISVRQSGTALVVATGGQSPRDRYTIFIGPKELDILNAVGRSMERVIDFGYFGFISKPLLYVLHFFHGFTGSYGLDIILLTVIIKILLAPLTHKSFMSMKAMQKLQPQMEKLRERYKDDREKLNKEIMEMYRRHGVNPLGGCLPMVLQFPVFIGLYNALSTPIELRHAPFLWVKDLSRPDWESLPFELAGWQLGVPVLTILMGASMFLQQWMMPMAGDPMQRRLMMLMPLLFTFLFVSFPAGLTVYWLVNNVLSIGQQYWINRQSG